jgi:predicted N-acetyltransferase YhbS
LEVATERGWRQLCLVAIQGSVPYWARYGFEEAPSPQPDMLASYGDDARLMRLSLQRRQHQGASA